METKLYYAEIFVSTGKDPIEVLGFGKSKKEIKAEMLKLTLDYEPIIIMKRVQAAKGAIRFFCSNFKRTQLLQYDPTTKKRTPKKFKNNRNKQSPKNS